MARRTTRIATSGLLSVLLGALLVGCGGDSDPSPSAADPSTPEASTAEASTADPSPTATETTAPGPEVERFLLQADEVPGLTPVSLPATDTGPPFELPPEGTAILERSGYVSTTYQPAEGTRSGGVSSVVLFETAAGARTWLAYETSDAAIQHQIPGVEIERFEVPGVPGATGWTGPDLHGNAIGHVYWTQGRCMLLIGLEVEGPRVARLSAGVRAIYERTGGTCPD